MKDAVTLEQINDLCADYAVPFSITVDGNLLFYNFGPVKWCIVAQSPMNLYSLFKVAQRLAATFPEKVLT